MIVPYKSQAIVPLSQAPKLVRPFAREVESLSTVEPRVPLDPSCPHEQDIAWLKGDILLSSSGRQLFSRVFRPPAGVERQSLAGRPSRDVQEHAPAGDSPSRPMLYAVTSPFLTRHLLGHHAVVEAIVLVAIMG